MRTKLAVPAGTFDQCSGGDTPSDTCRRPPGGGMVAAHEYFTGMVPPSENAGVVSVSGGITFGRAGAAPCCAIAGTAAPTSSRTPSPNALARIALPSGARFVTVAVDLATVFGIQPSRFLSKKTRYFRETLASRGTGLPHSSK